MVLTPKSRLLSKIQQPFNYNGCWTWIGATTGGGYGQIHFDGKTRLAHRVSYALLIGEIKEGLVLDHKCRNRLCINPWHLEQVTQRENLRRGESPCSDNFDKTVCVNGHEFTKDNTYLYKKLGHRICKRCRANREKERRRKKAESLKRNSPRGLVQT